MFQRHFTFKDEPRATLLTGLLFAASFLMVLFFPKYLRMILPSPWMGLMVPFLVVIGGALILRTLRAVDTLRHILVWSVVAGVFFVFAGGAVAATGYTIAKGNLQSVPRLFSLNFFYLVILLIPIIISSALRYQVRLREIDG